LLSHSRPLCLRVSYIRFFMANFTNSICTRQRAAFLVRAPRLSYIQAYSNGVHAGHRVRIRTAEIISARNNKKS
jgi:hypothetical protein